MKAIMVIFVQTRVPAGQPLVFTIGEGWPAIAVLNIDKSTRAEKWPTHNEAAPFWTWFIENPRPDPSRSLLPSPLEKNPQISGKS
jgi:hypothetical protein